MKKKKKGKDWKRESKSVKNEIKESNEKEKKSINKWEARWIIEQNKRK